MAFNIYIKKYIILILDIAIPKIIEALRSEIKAVEVKSAYLDYFMREDTLTGLAVFTVTGLGPADGLNRNENSTY